MCRSRLSSAGDGVASRTRPRRGCGGACCAGPGCRSRRRPRSPPSARRCSCTSARCARRAGSSTSSTNPIAAGSRTAHCRATPNRARSCSLVRYDPATDEVHAEVDAFSRHATWWSRLGSPVTSVAQRVVTDAVSAGAVGGSSVEMALRAVDRRNHDLNSMSEHCSWAVSCSNVLLIALSAGQRQARHHLRQQRHHLPAARPPARRRPDLHDARRDRRQRLARDHRRLGRGPGQLIRGGASGTIYTGRFALTVSLIKRVTRLVEPGHVRLVLGLHQHAAQDADAVGVQLDVRVRGGEAPRADPQGR